MNQKYKAFTRVALLAGAAAVITTVTVVCVQAFPLRSYNCVPTSDGPLQCLQECDFENGKGLHAACPTDAQCVPYAAWDDAEWPPNPGQPVTVLTPEAVGLCLKQTPRQ